MSLLVEVTSESLVVVCGAFGGIDVVVVVVAGSGVAGSVAVGAGHIIMHLMASHFWYSVAF